MPVTLLFGDNSLEIGDAVRAERARFDDADTVILDGLESPLSALSEAFLTAGLFAPERLVLIHGVHRRYRSAKKENTEATQIRSMLSAVVPSTTVLLVERDMAGDHALIADARAAGARLRQFSAPKKNDIPRWITGRAKTIGARIDAQAAELLADMIGPNPVMIQTELEKLATFAGPEAISPAAVEQLVGVIAQDTIFALIDAIAAGDRSQALRLLHSQMEAASGGPIDLALYLIRMLARQMRILLRIRLGQEAGRSQPHITSDLKLPRYYADRYFKQARRLSTSRLQQSFEQLTALEHGLKTGRADPSSGLDLLVAELCA